MPKTKVRRCNEDVMERVLYVREMLRLSIRQMVEVESIEIKLIAVGEVYAWKTTPAIESGNCEGEEVP